MPFTKTFNPGEILTAADVNDNLLNGGYQYRETVYFTSSGTFVKADYPWLKAIRVRCVGGGAAGGNIRTTSTNANPVGCGGGGGGGYAESFITDIAGLDASVTVTRGAGGNGDTTSDRGQAGSASSFGALVVAEGGLGGFSSALLSPGTYFGRGGEGGLGTSGDFQSTGYAGSVGGPGTQLACGGSGGGSLLGGFGVGTSVAQNNGAVGGNAQGPGGGGGGAVRINGSTLYAGGNGSAGFIIVDLFG